MVNLFSDASTSEFSELSRSMRMFLCGGPERGLVILELSEEVLLAHVLRTLCVRADGSDRLFVHSLRVAPRW